MSNQIVDLHGDIQICPLVVMTSFTNDELNFYPYCDDAFILDYGTRVHSN